MTTLSIGLAVFLGIHLVPTNPGLRRSLQDRFGANAYKGLFSLLSLAGLAMIVIGYGEARGLARANPQIFVPPSWTRHVTYLLMAAAMVLLAAAYVPSRIRDRAGHPMLAAIALWALGHLLVRGDLASLLLFGSFLAYAAYDRVSAQRRAAPGPLGNVPGTVRGDAIALAVGLGVFAVMLLWGHGALIGVPLLSRGLAFA